MFDELCYECNYYWMNNPDDPENSCHGDPMLHGCVPDEWLSPMTINYSDEKVIKDPSRKTIFLAGPTKRNSEFLYSWRNEACDILRKMGFDGIVYVPEKASGGAFDYLDQVNWEREALMTADIILFYVPRKLPDMPGFTTNVEYGMYLAKRPDNVEFCSPEDAEKNRYLEWLYLEEKPDGIIYRTLVAALSACVDKLNK